MFPKMLTSLLMLILATSQIQAIYECCPEENMLSMITKMCSTNETISLECDGLRFPVMDESKFISFNYILMNNGTLIDEPANMEVGYCHAYPDEDSKNLSKHIFIVCKEETGEDNFDYQKIRVGAILGYISVVFVILTIAVYAIVPKLLDLQGICLIHMLTGLALGYIILGVIQLTTYLDDIACTSLAFVAYFCFLYLFFWLNILSFHLWRITVQPRFLRCTTQWPFIYHIFAIGGSLTILTFLLLAHFSTSEVWDDIRPGFGEKYCWFKSMRETMIFFYGPIGILLTFNFIFYVWSIIKLWRQAETSQSKVLKYRLKLCIRLFIIMGLSWSFEIITAIFKNTTSLYVKIFFSLLDLFNLLQGLLIFLVLVVFRKRVRRALASKNLFNIPFPNSWKYLEDEEMESVEDRVNHTVVEFKENNVELKR